MGWKGGAPPTAVAAAAELTAPRHWSWLERRRGRTGQVRSGEGSERCITCPSYTCSAPKLCPPTPHTLAPAASIAAVLCRALSRRTRPGGERSERTPPPVVGLPCTTRAARALPQPACSQVWGGERSERTQPRLLQGVCLWACLSPQASLGRFPGARLRSSGAPYFAVAAPNSLSFRLLPSRSLCSASLPSSPPSYLQHSHTRVCAPPLPSIPLTCSTAMLASAPWP